MIINNIYAVFFIKFLLSILLFVILFVPISSILLIFLIYRTFVLIILKLKFGSQFGGIMTGLDAFFANDGASTCVINVLGVVKTKKSFEEFFSKFKDEVNRKIFGNPERFPKFISTRNKMCGYHYFILNQISVDKCIRKFDLHSTGEELSQKEVIQGINKYSTKTLPYNNTAFWEFLLCEKPVRWHNKADQSEKSYVILLRFHHCLADGINLAKFMISMLSVSFEDKKIDLPAKNKFWNKIRDFLHYIYVMLMTPIVMVFRIYFWNVEVSSIDVPSLSDQEIIVGRTEESIECLKILKGIKKNEERTSFADVLLAAVSKSLSNYFEKKGKDPDLSKFSTYLTVLMKKSQLLTQSKITNMFSFVKLNIPIIYKSNTEFSNYDKSFKETLEKVKTETKVLFDPLDYEVTHALIQLVSAVFPEKIVVRLITPPYLPLVITNLPGPSTLTLLDDCVVEDIMFWLPLLNPMGMTMGFFSYEQRLQITLTVDKAIMSNEEDAQDIVDGVYQALLQLDSKV